tara:strand:- start:154 stop:378 length:225 start_codon:yes stop_codon:yes gene_type:complete
MAYKINWDRMWQGHKYYPKHFKTRKEEFMHRLTTGAITTKHLQQIMLKFPYHKWINEMKTEMTRRKNASKMEKK